MPRPVDLANIAASSGSKMSPGELSVDCPGRHLSVPLSNKAERREMAIPIPHEKTEAPVGKLASTGSGDPTGTIRVLCQNEPHHDGDARPLCERLRPIIERYRALPDSGEIAGKAFFDDLSGNV